MIWNIKTSDWWCKKHHCSKEMRKQEGQKTKYILECPECRKEEEARKKEEDLNGSNNYRAVQ